MKKNYLSLNGYCILLVLSLQIFNAKAQQSYTFTNCGATGRVGPTQTQVNATYTGTNPLSGNVGVTTTGIQTWTVPSSGLYRITANGASSGMSNNSPGNTIGKGTSIQGEFNLTVGDVIQVLVGQKGQDFTYAAGGGGGSFVTKTPHNTLASILVVAGGGGSPSADDNGVSASTSTCGNFGTNSGPSTCNGDGGISFTGNSGGGGGGFFTNGQGLANVSGNTYGNGGDAYVNGGQGATSLTGSYGGFGGGGMHNPTGTTACGHGGGGFSGGNGGNRALARQGGGGGGSYNNGANQVNSVLTTTGDGIVIIQQLNTPINVTASSSIICTGAGPITMTASGVSTYTWLPVGNFAGSNSAVITDNPSSTTVYTVQGTDALGLSISQFTIFVNNPQVNIVPSDIAICAGQSTTLVASGANSYNWVSQSGGFSTINSGTLVFNSNTMPGGAYDVTGTDTAACVAPMQTVTVTVLSPAASISGPSNICKGNFYTLSASGADTYTWNTGSNTSTISVSPNTNTVYTVIGAQSQGSVSCYSSASLAITANNSPGVGAISNHNTVCSGESLVLTAIGADTYTWTYGSTTHAGSIWQVNPISSQASTQVYTVTGSNQYNCTNTFTIAITVDPCTGIVENNESQKISIYPNPNSGEFTVEINNKGLEKSIKLYDLTGRIIMTRVTTEQKIDFNIHQLSKGIYYLQVQSDSENYTIKIVKE